MESPAPSENHFQPRVEDHIALHYHDFIFHPQIRGIWSQDYAGEISQFLIAHEKKISDQGKQAVGRIILSPNWTESLDCTPLNDLHLAEADVREISPFTLQQVLITQERLYKAGVIPSDKLVAQRDEILARVGEAKPASDNSNLADIGKRICGLELCAEDVWLLKGVSPESADQLQALVTERYGARYYDHQLRFDMDYNRGGVGNIPPGGENEGVKCANEASRVSWEYINGLPKDVRDQYAVAKAKALRTTMVRDLRDWFDDVKIKLTSGLTRFETPRRKSS